MIALKKATNGELLVKVVSPEILIPGASMEMVVERFPIRIQQFLLPQSMGNIIAMDGVTVKMLCSSVLLNEENKIGRREGTRNSVKRLFYRGLTFLAIDLTTSYPFLCNHEGNVLSGSNVFGGDRYGRSKAGSLCLGESFNAIGIDALHMLFHYNPNNDLGFNGEAITVESPRKRNVLQWPTITNAFTPSPQLLGACKQLGLY